MGASKLICVPLTAVLLVTGAGCSRKSNGATPPPLPEVRVVEAREKDVPLYREWIGTLDGLVNADIKAEVSGYLIEQAYQEGTPVSKGQLLFQIDPRPFQASLDQAKGQLAQSEAQLEQAQAQLSQAKAQVAVAEANQGRTQLDVERYTPLAKQQAITQEDLDNAVQNNMAAKAQLQSARAQVETAAAQISASSAAVQAARAAVETAQINLGFTHVTAPIEGIPGIAQLQVGALVSPSSGVMTTISTVDPIKVYFTVSEQEYLSFTRRFPTGEQRRDELDQRQFELILADGIPYSRPGRFSFADRQVDVRTGAIRLAALFPNPGYSLRPGEYGRVRTATTIQKGAVLVPQRAVTELQGTRMIAVVDGGNKVGIRPVSVGETVGTDWIVTEGLRAGERVIAEGIQKVRQGMIVNPKPFATR
jgi:membrane fusion protein (multidrug efflux system)